MPGKHFDLDTNKNLGGENSSDITIASQKATKSYIDTEVGKKQGKLTAGTGISISNDNIISVTETGASSLTDLTDTSISSPSDKQVLSYNSSDSKWENKSLSIPSKTSDLTNDSDFITKSVNDLTNYTNNTDLSTALSGKANTSHSHTKSEITDFPTIPTVNDKTITIQTNGSDAGSFTTNASASKTINLAIPSQASDVGAAESTHSHTKSEITDFPTNVSSFTNDAGYLTSQDISSVFVYKGTKASESALPTSGNKKGDVWTVSENGAEYVWDGTAWQYLGETLDLSGYVPTGRKVNNKALSSDITLSGADVAITGYSKATQSATLSASDTLNIALGKLEKALDGKQASGNYVETSRKINNKALTSDINLTYSDVGALSASTSIPTVSDTYSSTSTDAMSGKAVNSAISGLTYSDVGALSASTSIPNVTDTYSSTSGDAMSGKAVYSAVSSISIPTVNDKKITIQTNGTDVDSFTTNASASKTINIAVPSQASDIDAAESSHTHTKSEITDFPTIPTVTNTYSSTSNDAMSGKAIYSAVNGLTYTDVNAASSSHTHTYSDVGAASASHTHSYTYTDVGAASSAHTHTYSDVGAASSSHTHSNYVPTTRTIAGKALTSNVTLSASDVGALPSGTSIPTITDTYSSASSDGMSGKAVYSAISGISIPSTASDVSAAESSHTHTKSEITDFPTIPTITDTYSSTSSNGMSGKAVYSAVKDKADKSTSLSGYGITDAYTKTEVDNKLTSAMVYKGTKASESALPTTGNKVGDVWNVTDTGHNYAWDGSAWDKLSGTVDLSGYVPTTRKIAGKALTGDVTLSASDVGAATSGHTHTYSDVGAASSSHTHSGYVPTSRTINSKALSDNITLTYSDVGALSSSTSIPTITDTYSSTSSNGMSGKAVKSAIDGVTYSSIGAASSSHTHSYSDVGAASESHTHTYSDVGAASASHTHSGYVPTSRTVAGKALTNNVTLSASDVGALPSDTTIPTITDTYSSTSTNGMSGKAVYSAINGLTYSSVGAASSSHTHTYSDVGAASSSHTHSGYVPTSRKVAGKALTADITLSASDVGALPSGTTIPTVTDTYSSTSTNAMSGKAVYSAVSGLTYTNVGAASASHTHTYSDVGAASSSHTHTYSDVGAASSSHTHSGYVATSRKVAGKALTSDITLSASDVGALPSNTTIPTITDTYSSTSTNGMSGKAVYSAVNALTYSSVGAASASHTHTYSDVGAASSSHTHSGYVATSRKVAGKALTADITLSASDVGALPSNTTIPTVTDTYSSTSTNAMSGKAVYSAVNGITYTSIGAASSAHTHSYTYSDVGAASSSHTHTYSQVGAASSSHTHTYSAVGAASAAHTHSYTYSDVGAASASHTHSYTYSDVGAASSSHTHTYSDVGAASSSHTHSAYAFTAGTGLSLSGTTFNHSNSITAGTAGTTAATSGYSLAVPYVTYDAQGHVTAKGTHTHTVTSKIDGVTTSNGTATRFGTCSTAAATAAKTVSITTGTFSLETGAKVTVKFSNLNTADNPTLNVNSTGAKNIFHNGTQITNSYTKGYVSGVVEFVYDGTQWNLIGNYYQGGNILVGQLVSS